MKPVGLIDPAAGKRPFAVVQLRAENNERTLYNLVGFQTKMTHPEQERVFRMIPGMENAVFSRLGSVHRNTYLDGPSVLDQYSRPRALPHIFFAGQITGVEGYIESTASGLAVGIMAALIAKGSAPAPPPSTTAVGALLKHTRESPKGKYEPMNINFGIIDPPPAGTAKRLRKEAAAERALAAATGWMKEMDNLSVRSGI
jgi:methylenetetrahydrofolate--tRNA-(uracil-5-)-methyltransferase